MKKMSRSVLMLLVLVLAFGTFLVACGKGGETTTENPPANTTTPPTTGTQTPPVEEGPPKGGTVTFAMFSAPGGVFNPIFYSDAYESNIIENIFDSLFEMQDDLSYGPYIAESWEFSEDYKDLTVKLRNDVKWHDGVQFTAKDVYYTYSLLAHGDYNGNRSSYADVLVGYEEFNSGAESTFRGVEVLNDYELIFHFKEGMPTALDNASFYIIPEHIYGKYNLTDMATAPETLEFDKLVGTGPFKPSKFVANENYEFVSNQDYFQGAPNIDGIVWRVVDASVAIGMLETGELDIYDAVTPADFDMVSAIPGITIHETQAFAYQYMGIKMNIRPKAQIDAEDYSQPSTWTPNPKFAEKKLRQAMAYAIDRQGIVDSLIQGHGTVLNAPIPAVSWAAAPADQLNPYPFDPEKAKQLLDEAGYVDKDGNGFREDPQGNKWSAKIDYPNGNPVRFASAPLISQWLKDVGLNVELNAPRDAGTHFVGLDFDEAELFLAGWSLSIDPDPIGIWRTTEPYNNSRWFNEQSNKLMQDGVSLKALLDQDYRAKTYVDWQKLINEELPYVFLYSQNEMYAYNSAKIQNVKPGPLGITRDMHEWWIEK